MRPQPSVAILHNRILSHGQRTDGDSRITAQQISIGELEPWKDGRGAKGRARLAATLCAVADVECQGLLDGCLEGDGPALASDIHCAVLIVAPCD